MNHLQFSKLQLNLSGLGSWIAVFAVIWLLGSIGLGWLVKSVLALMVLLLVAPVIAVLGFRWWLRRNVVEDQCPVCGTPSIGINNAQIRCPNCSEVLKIEGGHFLRVTPPGTVDVSAIEVPSAQLED